MASVLPLKTGVLKKFKQLMGKYLWNFSGKVLRVAIDEIKNKKWNGGLNLPCLASMADALLLSQFVRLIRSGDKMTMEHAVQFKPSECADVYSDLN